LIQEQIMKRFAALCLVAPMLFLAGCDSTDSPTASTIDSTRYTFTAQLSPANEVPPVTNAESGGSGNVTITLIVAKDSNGNPSSASIDFDASFSGFPAGTTLTGAHIHPGAAGTTGGILVSTAIAAGEVTMPAGSGTLSKKSLTLTVEQANGLIANPAGFYFNIHTALNPGGAARGQLKAS
jgi:hypothetical protein